jgi:pyrimidine operon attenuation protein/uracil phosphoribosyltransferase
MALLKFLFDRREKLTGAQKHRSVVYESPEAIGPQCRNPNCVTLNESISTRRKFQILSPEEGSAWVIACLYCDHRSKVQYIGNAKSKRYSSFDPGLVRSLREWLKTGELAIFDTIKEAEELGYEPIKSGPQRILLNESEINQALVDIARQILRDCQNPDRLLILGVRSVGSQLAQRLAQEIEKQRQRRPESGEIEIFGAGEELRRVSPADPDAGPLNLKDREVILVDDVLYTGRTVKSALSIIFRSGRPQSVRLAVLIDRGHREVPVRPNYVGKNIPTAENERVRVKLRGFDQENRDQAVLYSMDHAAGATAPLPAREGTAASR